jgi:hypothetical protein
MTSAQSIFVHLVSITPYLTTYTCLIHRYIYLFENNLRHFPCTFHILLIISILSTKMVAWDRYMYLCIKQVYVSMYQTGICIYVSNRYMYLCIKQVYVSMYQTGICMLNMVWYWPDERILIEPRSFISYLL